MCRQTNVQAAGNAASKSLDFPDAEGVGLYRRQHPQSDRASREGSGGVVDWGMHEEDIPGTWEALADLGKIRATEARLPTSDAPFVMRERERPVSRSTTAWHAEKTCPHKVGPTKGRPEVVSRLGKGVGWPHTSDDGGERRHRTRPSKGGQCR